MLLLLAAALVGLAAGWLRARIQHLPYPTVTLRHPWLVFLAFLPQWLAFGLQVTREQISTPWASAALITSQILLLVFVWFNRSHPAFWLLGLGLIFNFCVIILNGGLMPISPETVHQLYPTALASEWQIGSRLGTGKDIVLTVEQTRLWFLSDRFLTPPALNYQAAFSLGDVLIALGACWLLYAPGKTPKREGEVSWLLVSRKAN